MGKSFCSSVSNFVRVPNPLVSNATIGVNPTLVKSCSKLLNSFIEELKLFRISPKNFFSFKIF